MNGGPIPSCLCPRCTAKNLAQESKIFVNTKAKPYLRFSFFSIIYWHILGYIAAVSHFLRKVRQVFASTAAHTSNADRLPASSSEVAFGLSIQYLVGNALKCHSITHFIFHKLWLCKCKDLDEIAKLRLVNFPMIHYEGNYGDFDRFRPVEHAFVVKKTLPSGGEASSCVVMQHVHTKRPRKLYVFKTVAKDKSLISHPEHGIISNEAYILLGKLKTNLYPHPNIIQLFNCVSSNAVAGIPIHILQMEFCDGGDLWDLNNRCVSHDTRIPKPLASHIFISLSAALAYLHHGLVLSSSGSLRRKYLPGAQNQWQPILHNDIKPENILLRWPAKSTSSSETTYPDIVLADFGAAGVETHIRGSRGTYVYSAPEVREAFDNPTSLMHRFRFTAADRVTSNIVLTTKSDIWGFGAVMRFLFFDFDRERGGKDWEGKEMQSKWADVGEVYGEKTAWWVRRCLGYRALGRPSARTLLGVAVAEIKEDNNRGPGLGVQRLPEWI
ncbi:kinase-like protein, partial [Aureobasidium melanogenum]